MIRLVTIDDALRHITSGCRVVTAMAACEPRLFFENVHGYARTLSDVSIYCANPSQDFPCFSAQELCGRVEFLVMFMTPCMRARHGQGLVHYIPQHLSNWSRNLLRDKPVDVFWGTCSPPDERGYVSLGLSATYEPEIFRAARVRVLEINPRMPVSFGATHIASSSVDCFVTTDQDLPKLAAARSDECDRKIGAFIAELIADGSTVQFGIGSIPNALAVALAEKRDLGVHTEMINDAMMHLYCQGVITGARKTLWPGKIVGAFAYGSAELYKFVDKNPMLELQPASVVNDPYRIGRNFQMVSVNAAVQIDLTGQVCSESVGHRELSGVGGSFETHVGAQRSPGGRGILALHSTTKDGNNSKIVFELDPGAKVSISRNDVDTVVTEYGIAQLVGKSTAERVRLLVAIAHPKFRDALLRQAKDAGYL